MSPASCGDSVPSVPVGSWTLHLEEYGRVPRRVSGMGVYPGFSTLFSLRPEVRSRWNRGRREMWGDPS